ncbi:MBL fold metallo-hydrolase RNA specificity domain-containing protein [candidate division KSB1 bacterium]
MHITFYGGVREVTGSMHLLNTKTDKILIDCGMFQGRRKESEEKNRILPIDPGILSNVVLTHAHIDHSGRLPILTKNNFKGRIICTRATYDESHFLLLDSAHIQESDAEYLNYKSLRGFLYELKQNKKTKQVSNREINRIKKLLKKDRHKLNSEEIENLQGKYNLNRVLPLYTTPDAEKALEYFDSYPYRHRIDIGKDITCKFYDAGHILGSSFVIIQITRDNEKKTICFTGDIGRFDQPILRDPTMEFEEEDRDIDLLVMESTYGDRLHDSHGNTYKLLKNTLIKTYERGGTVVIPSFALGRTQELIYVLHELYDKGEVTKVPIFIDSPLGINLTKVFGEHPECYDEETHDTFLERGKNPFIFKHINFVKNVQDSMALMRNTEPHIIISSSGMCEAGRILHHLRYKIHDPRNTIIFAGFMAQHTLGRRILEFGLEHQASENNAPDPLVKILGKMYPLRAEVVQLGGFSAHGDRDEMTRFATESNLNIKQIALVHGEEGQTLKFGEHLKELGKDVIIPHRGESIFL